QYDQSLVYLDKAAALPGSDPSTLYNRAMTLQNMDRPAEAEAAFDEVLALAPRHPGANVRKSSLLLDYHGDLDRARAQLLNIPPEYLADDPGAYWLSMISLYSRDYAKCLTALRSAREYMQVSTFTGPKGVLTGQAHALAGNAEAAETER